MNSRTDGKLNYTMMKMKDNPKLKHTNGFQGESYVSVKSTRTGSIQKS